MTILTEGRHAGEFILSEGAAGYSRDNLKIAISQTIVPGQVLGAKVTVADATAVASADAGNTASSGTIAMDATPLTSTAKNGRYVGVASAATKVDWTDPEGQQIGVSTHGTLFNKGGVRFTITAGGTPNVVGDTWYVDVGVEPGDIQYVAYNQDGTDGSQFAKAIAYDGIVTGSGATGKVAGITRLAQVKGVALTWPGDITAAEKALGISQLAAQGIIVR
ncbi:head decoration protein [Metarhizobium album]|uniref:Head decoration protein n=1 Tax=Metarhizobium album TaxID=2182425 RepID=A0A2U2DG33_9HYPH|nr:head decoration protein [Rhizobium album]PWE52285.1 head decoration protein [Rhizobium album]